MKIEWNEDLTTGIEVIDRDHREIFNRFNDFNDACNKLKGQKELYELHEFLKQYVDEHFAREEKLQKDAGYQDFEEHRIQHEAIKKEFGSLATKLEDLGRPSALIVVKTNMALARLLIHHIQVLDAKFVNFLKIANSS